MPPKAHSFRSNIHTLHKKQSGGQINISANSVKAINDMVLALFHQTKDSALTLMHVSGRSTLQATDIQALLSWAAVSRRC
jgi:histone H3/H4